MKRGFWRGRRVLVTGHTGFKGAWLALMLESLGAELHGLALAPATVDTRIARARRMLRELADAEEVECSTSNSEPDALNGGHS